MIPSPDAHLPLDTLLQPESDLEKLLLTLPEFQQGLRWGEPRFGHPEGDHTQDDDPNTQLRHWQPL